MNYNWLIGGCVSCLSVVSMQAMAPAENAAVRGCLDTVYVSPIGSDDGDGSEKQPFYSLNRALEGRLDNASADTLVVLVGSGDYYLSSPLFVNSPSARPVLIKAQGKEKPRMIGGMKIGGWQKCDGKIYRAYIPEVKSRGYAFEQFYVNGHRAVMARTPNVDWNYVEGSDEFAFKEGVRFADYALQRIRFNPEELQSLANIPMEQRKDVRLRFYHKWDITQKHAEYIDTDSGYIYVQGRGMHPWNRITKGSRYVMSNYLGALDTPGEWYLDKEEGYLYYMPREGEEMDDAYCVAPALHQFVVMRGKAGQAVKNICFDNLSFQYASYSMPDKGDEPMQAAAEKEAAMMFDFVENISLVDCEIVHTGSYAVWFRRECHDNRIERCYLADLGAGGVKLGEPYWRPGTRVSSGNVIHNNIITHAGMELPCGVGVAMFHTSDNEVTHNEISDLRYSGVSIGWVWGYNNSPDLWTSAIDGLGKTDFLQTKLVSPAVRNVVEYNHIHHIGWGELSDMGAVYTLGESEGTRVSHNVIHDVWSYDYGGWGLYTDEGSTGVTMTHNLVYRCKSGAFHQHYGKDNRIENNIFAFGHYYQVQYTRVEPHLSFSFKRNIILQDRGETLAGPWESGHIDMDYNLYWHLAGKPLEGRNWKEWQKQKEPHSVVADPCFKAAGKDDFRFKSLRSVRRIGFEVFDYSKAGVYGPEEWVNKAGLDKIVLERFREAAAARQQK